MAPSLRFRTILLLITLALLAAGASAASFIQVYVHPGSGTVCLDNTCQVDRGTLAGYSSTQFQDVSCGQDHTIRVYDTEGYEDYTDTVYMDYNCDSFTSRIYLEPVPVDIPGPSTGDIQVFVSPGLGQVCRDDRECEVSTGEPVDTWSVRFSDVTADEPHTITATADGYQQYTGQASVAPGGVVTMDIGLVPLPGAAAPAAPAPAATKSPVSVATALVAGALAAALLAVLKCRD